MPLSSIERKQFLNWCLSHKGTWIHQAITFKSSEIEGTGVFLSIDKLTEKEKSLKEDPLVVLKVPKTLSLSIDTVAEQLLTRQLKYEVESQGNPELLKQGHILIDFLSKLRSSFEQQVDPYVRGGLNETNILVGEIQTLMILKEIRDRKQENSYNETPFGEFDPYFDLLLKIDVNAVKTDEELYEDYKVLFKYNEREFRYQIETLRNTAVLNAVNSAFPELDICSFITTNWLRRVEMAVISRILEIPEPLSIEDQKQGKKGFGVSSTLVPIIDFVNHSNDLVNSYFDADKENGDIVLKLDLCKLIPKQEVELFIQYSDYEDTFRFLHSYAFIPKSITIRPLYELPIDREYLKSIKIANYDLSLILKWFQIQPNVQFVITYNPEFKIDKLRINLDNNFIVFGFSEGLTYDSEIAFDIVDSSLSEFGEFSQDLVAKYLNLEESFDNDVIVDYPTTPFVNDKGEVFENIQDLITNTNDDDIERLIKKFIIFLNEYVSYRLNQLEIFLKIHKDSTKSSNVIQFINFEIELLNKFKQEYNDIEDKQDLIIGAEDCDDEWQKLRLAPRTINNVLRQQIFEDSEENNVQQGIADISLD